MRSTHDPFAPCHTIKVDVLDGPQTWPLPWFRHERQQSPGQPALAELKPAPAPAPARTETRTPALRVAPQALRPLPAPVAPADKAAPVVMKEPDPETKFKMATRYWTGTGVPTDHCGCAPLTCVGCMFVDGKLVLLPHPCLGV